MNDPDVRRILAKMNAPEEPTDTEKQLNSYQKFGPKETVASGETEASPKKESYQRLREAPTASR